MQVETRRKRTRDEADIGRRDDRPCHDRDMPPNKRLPRSSSSDQPHRPDHDQQRQHDQERRSMSSEGSLSPKRRLRRSRAPSRSPLPKRDSTDERRWARRRMSNSPSPTRETAASDHEEDNEEEQGGGGVDRFSSRKRGRLHVDEEDYSDDEDSGDDNASDGRNNDDDAGSDRFDDPFDRDGGDDVNINERNSVNGSGYTVVIDVDAAAGDERLGAAVSGTAKREIARSEIVDMTPPVVSVPAEQPGESHVIGILRALAVPTWNQPARTQRTGKKRGGKAHRARREQQQQRRAAALNGGAQRDTFQPGVVDREVGNVRQRDVHRDDRTRRVAAAEPRRDRNGCRPQEPKVAGASRDRQLDRNNLRPQGGLSGRERASVIDAASRIDEYHTACRRAFVDRTPPPLPPPEHDFTLVQRAVDAYVSAPAAGPKANR